MNAGQKRTVFKFVLKEAAALTEADVMLNKLVVIAVVDKLDKASINRALVLSIMYFFSQFLMLFE